MRARWVAFVVAPVLPIAAACGLDDSVAVQGGLPTGSGDGGGDATLSTDSGPGGGDGSTTDGASAIDGAPPPPVLVYANAQTELFSFDVNSHVLTHLGTFINCGSATNANDIATDPSGQMYLLQKNDAIYKLAADGNCSFREQLTSDTSSINKIGGRANGTPAILALNSGNNNIYSIDPAAGTNTEINGSILPDDGTFDLVCSHEGTCWGAFDHGHCSAGASSSCLYSFPDDGGVDAVPLGAIGVHPAGLAFANGVLFSFGDDGKITQIPLGGSPVANAITPTLASGTTAPAQWNGATSPL